MNLKAILKKIKSWERPISIGLGIVVVVLIGVLIFNFFRSQGEETAIEEGGGFVSEETGQTIEKEGEVKLPATHKVVRGENLWKIAEHYYGSGYNWVDIAKENKLSNPDRLLVDQELIIPDVPVRHPESGEIASGKKVADISEYTVEKGDSLWKIAEKIYGDGYSWMKIYQANQEKIGANPGLIFSGTVLTIP